MNTPSCTEDALKLAREALAFYAAGKHISKDSGDLGLSPQIEPGHRATEAIAALDRFATAPANEHEEFIRFIDTPDANGWSHRQAMSATDLEKVRLGYMGRAKSGRPVPTPMTADEWWQGMDEAVTALRGAAKTFSAHQTTAAQEVMESAAKRIDRIRWQAFETYIRTTPDKERQLNPTPQQPLCDKDKATLTRWAIQIERLAPLFPDERAQMCRLVESLIMTVVACTKTLPQDS